MKTGPTNLILLMTLALEPFGCSGSGDSSLERGGAPAASGGSTPASGGTATTNGGSTPATGGTAAEIGGAASVAVGGNPMATGGSPNSGGNMATGGAVSTGGANTAGTVTGGNASGGAAGTPGCNGNATPTTSPSNGSLTIDVKGASRQYVLELPTAYDGKTPVPVIFTLHGTGTTAQEFLGSSYGNVRAGIAGRALLAGLQGLSRNGQTGWAGNGGIEQVDVDFFDAVLAQLKAGYCIDPARVFAMGHSAGAMFSNELGCRRSSAVRAIGPVAGGGPNGNCGGKVAAMIVHNPAETLVVWSTFGWPTVQYWTSKNGCDSPGTMPAAAFAGNSTTGIPLPCQAYAGCDPDYPVTLCLHSYTDQWDGAHAFPPQWGGKATTDFFLSLPRVQ